MNAGESRAVVHGAMARMTMIMIGVTMGVRVIVVVIAVMMVVAMSVRVVVIVAVLMRVVMAVLMCVTVAVAVRVIMRLGFRLIAFLRRRSASANRAHHSTSNSLTRIASPTVICTRWRPHSGHCPKRSRNPTVFSQSRQ